MIKHKHAIPKNILNKTLLIEKMTEKVSFTGYF